MNKPRNYTPDKLIKKTLRKLELQRFTMVPQVKRHDVTDSFTDIDLSALDVIQWTPAHMTRAERLLLFTLVFTLRPERYLEIGTLKGGSALIVAAAMKASGSEGQLVCVDPRPQILPEHWEKLKDRSTLLTGFSPDILPTAQHVAGGPFDLVLIDGDHSYEGLMRDATGVLPFVRNGAYILFHDSFYHEVKQGLDDFVREHADEVVDFGAMTREITLQETEDEPIHWGGIRMVQVRRHGA